MQENITRLHRYLQIRFYHSKQKPMFAILCLVNFTTSTKKFNTDSYTANWKKF